jgi:hypothetical protein
MKNLLGGALLALTRFHTTQAPPSQTQPLVWVEGRRPGLAGFVLSKIGIDTTTALIISPRDVTFRSGSLFGQMSSMMPLTSVASVHAGHSKPIHYIALAVLFSLFGVMSAVMGIALGANGGVMIGAVCMVIALAMMIAYALNKRFALYVESSGGATLGLVFKPSVIEGVQVDSQRVQAVVDLTRELILAAQRGGGAQPSYGHAPATYGG